MNYFLILVLLLSYCTSCAQKPSNKDNTVILGDLDSVKLQADTNDGLVTDLDSSAEFQPQAIDGDLIVEDFGPLTVYDYEKEIEDVSTHIRNQLENEFVQKERRVPSASSEALSTYKLEKNEALMLIAWKLYGDYRRWKEIKRLNPNSKFAIGDNIKVPPYTKIFDYNPGGDPYFVIKGDTLGKISTKKYNHSRYWKNIWKHNNLLIRDPNLIFAGFTLYTPVIELNQLN